jgi:hypothetical protein
MQGLGALVKRPLYDSEIKSYLKKFKVKCPVIPYSKLYKCKDINTLLKKGDNCFILLYLSEDHGGHYTLVFKRNAKEIECFDSLNMKPDDELKYIDDNVRNRLNQDKQYLSQLLLKSKYKIHYNNHYLQNDDYKKVATCGRWCIVRLLYRDKTIDVFNKMIKKECKQYKVNPDQLVTLMTCDLKLE